MLAGQFGLGFGFGKVGEELLIELDRVGLFILLSADLGEPKQSGGGNGLLALEPGEDLLVLRGGGSRVAVDFFRVKALAEEVVEFGLGGGSC